MSELTLRRMDFHSYLRTAALATLVVALLYLVYYEFILHRMLPFAFDVVQGGEEVRRAFFAPSNISGLVANFLTTILSIRLWGWLVNLAARRIGGVKLNAISDNASLTLARVSPFRFSLIVALAAIPLTAVGQFMEATAWGWRVTDTPISVSAIGPGAMNFVLTALPNALASFVATWLIVWTYNRIAALTGGMVIGFGQGGFGRAGAARFRVTRIRVASALRIGFLLGLATVLFRMIDVAFSLLLLGVSAPSPSMSFSFSTVDRERFLSMWMSFLHIQLFLLVHTLFSWPLWALVYNWLARRFGGLELEVEGEWPGPVEAA